MTKLFSLFLFCISLYSLDINPKLLNADIKTYKALLENISKEKNTTSEQSLQKTLLYKLIDLSKTNILSEQNISSPKTQEDYSLLFEKYFNDTLDIYKLKDSIDKEDEKLKTLKSQKNDINSSIPSTAELFYLFYFKEKKTNLKKLSLLEKETDTIKKNLLTSLSYITFSEKDILKTQYQLNDDISNLETTLQQLLIKKERFKLLENNKLLDEISKKITDTNTQKSSLYKKLLTLQFLNFSQKLQKKDKAAFNIHKKILGFMEKKLKSREELTNDIDNFLSYMEKKRLGTIETIKGKGVQELKTQIANLWGIANKPLFYINKTPLSIFKLSISILIFIIGFLIGTLYKSYINRLSNKNKTITAGTRTLLSNLGYYLIFLITFFIVLKVLGIDLSSIALVAGALSVGIGFGLQNVISNFVSGIILMVERSVKMGDYIELDENLRGFVVDIKMRSITVNTNSNIDVIVPNQELIQNRVINWTMNDKIRRFEIPFGVAYGTKPQKVINVVLDAVKNSDFVDIYTSRDRFTRVVMTGMGDSSVNFELFVWLKGKEILYPKRTTSRFLILIYNALYENNIEIPFPQQDIHIKSIEADFPVNLSK